jgi:uncharacterized protein (DUF1501 family)
MKENRREFLIKSGCALGMTALATQMRHFGLMSAIAQNVSDETQNLVPSDYRALVCVFLSGGNDGNNYGHSESQRRDAQQLHHLLQCAEPAGLAVPQANLLPIAVPRMGGLSYGLHPALGIQPAVRTSSITVSTNFGVSTRWRSSRMSGHSLLR